jgi:MoxR-like ATPase
MNAKIAKTVSPAAGLQAQATELQTVAHELSQRYVGRRAAIDAMITAAVAGVPGVLVGPPGTAKTALLADLVTALGIAPADAFAWQMTRYTTPDELFGPVSLSALRDDRAERARAGKLAGAQAVTLDECFKANSATLNATLGAMNERAHEGEPCRWTMWFGASNEWPDGIQPGTQSDGDGLGAMWDRYLVREEVGYLRSTGDWESMMWGGPSPVHALPVGALGALQAVRSTVVITDPVRAAYRKLRDTLAAAKITPSDRRWRRSVEIVQAAAVCAGRLEAKPRDLRVLAWTLWDDLDQRAAVTEALRDVAGGIARSITAIEADLASIPATLDGLTGPALTAKAHESVQRVGKHISALDRLQEQADPDERADLARVSAGALALRVELGERVMAQLRL